MEALLKITGTDKSAVQAAEKAILSIIKTKAPEVVVLAGINALVSLASPNQNVTITNSHFEGGSSRAAIK